MICYIKGSILDLKNNKIEILTNGGVAYEIGISEVNYTEICDKHLENIGLFIYHNITDNSQALYGFLTRDEKNIFEELIKISGVGGKVALLILSLGINILSKAVVNEDNKTIESVKGIGKKMAEKIILELKDKELFKIGLIKSGDTSIDNSKKDINLEKDLIGSLKLTLVNMGYNAKQIDKVLLEIPKELVSINEILPWLIQRLS